MSREHAIRWQQKSEGGKMRLLYLSIVLLTSLTGPITMAAASVLVVSAGGTTRQFTSDGLLARHDAASLAISKDPA